MNKKFLLLTITVAILVGGFLLWRRSGVVSHEFVGRVQKVENNQIILKGYFVIKNNSSELVSAPKTEDISVLVTGDTKFTKTLIYLPTTDELKKTDGKYDPKNLKKEETSGSLDDIVNGVENMSITVKNNKNIYNKRSFVAQEILYTEPVFP